MKSKTANLSRLDILGNGQRSDQEIFSSVLKQRRKKLAYCSIFAAVPALLISHVEGARSDDAKRPTATVAGQGASRPAKQKLRGSNPALLKRQSEFLLPHQKGSFNMAATLAGNDDCPGSSIPGGNYTAAAPYTTSGDTTGANNTVTGLSGYYYYYNYSAQGPDQVYSFTLTGLGANPRIEVSTTSGTYRPMVYILDGRNSGCPTGTGNFEYNWLALNDSRWSTGNSTATLNVGYLPLNVPLHLFVDSALNDANGAGAYTIRMQDVTIAPAAACPNPNPIDCADVFVRQQYLDFLGREPDPLAGQWVSLINNCDPGNPSCDRIHVSEAFFKSPEFQERGYFTYRFYSVALGRKPDFAEFMPDLQRVSGFLTDAQLEAAKVQFINDFMARNAFATRYNSLSNESYVNTLLSTADVTLPLTTRQSLIDELNNGTASRAQVLRQIAESSEVYQKYYNQAFVVMQYFGYLRRDPDIHYLEWIDVLDTNPQDSRHMIDGFMSSIEYRQRFGP